MTKVEIFWDGSAVDNHIPNMPNRRCFGAYVIRETMPDGKILEDKKVFELPDAHTSDQAEYDALIVALQQILSISSYEKKEFKIVGDSLVVVRQVSGEWKINSLCLQARRKKVVDLMSNLNATLGQIDRDRNPAGHLLEINNKVRRTIESYGTKFIV